MTTRIPVDRDNDDKIGCPKCWYTVRFDTRGELEEHFNTKHLDLAWAPTAWMWRTRYFGSRWYIEQPDEPQFLIRELGVP